MAFLSKEGIKIWHFEVACDSDLVREFWTAKSMIKLTTSIQSVLPALSNVLANQRKAILRLQVMTLTWACCTQVEQKAKANQQKSSNAYGVFNFIRFWHMHYSVLQTV